MAVTHTRRYLFQAIHSLEALGEGRHGHHVYLEISFGPNGTIETADRCYSKFIAPRLHGCDVAEVVQPPTGENIVEWIHNELLNSPLGPDLVGVAIQETGKNRFISSKTWTLLV